MISKIFRCAVIAVIDKGIFLHKFKQCTVQQFIEFYRILTLQEVMSHLSKTFYKFHKL